MNSGLDIITEGRSGLGSQGSSSGAGAAYELLQFAQGTQATLDIWIYPGPGLAPVDPDGYPATEPMVAIYDPNGTLMSSGLAYRLGQGNYRYRYQLAADAPISSDWRIEWTFTVGGGIPAVDQRTEYFTVVSYEYASTFELLHDLRIRLKDTHPDYRKRRWTDVELTTFIENALWDINSTPPATTYFLVENWQQSVPDWKNLIIEGALVMSLVSQGILEVAKEFSYSDNGIAVTIDRSAKYQSMAQMILTAYQEKKQRIKNAYFMRVRRPHVIVSGELDRKIRTMAPAQWRIR